MAKDQNTYAKRAREMEKRRKAEAKRERRRKKKEEEQDGEFTQADDADVADTNADHAERENIEP